MLEEVIKEAPMTKIKGIILDSHMMRSEERHATKIVIQMNVSGWMGRGRRMKKWVDCMKNDMTEKSVDDC